MILTSVDFPLALSPRTPSASPRRRCRSTSRSATTAPKRLATCSTRTTSSGADAGPTTGAAKPAARRATPPPVARRRARRRRSRSPPRAARARAPRSSSRTVRNPPSTAGAHCCTVSTRGARATPPGGRARATVFLQPRPRRRANAPPRPAARELLADLQLEALEQLGHRVRPHLEAVALVELRQRLRVGLERATAPTPRCCVSRRRAHTRRDMPPRSAGSTLCRASSERRGLGLCRAVSTGSGAGFVSPTRGVQRSRGRLCGLSSPQTAKRPRLSSRRFCQGVWRSSALDSESSWSASES